MLVFCVIVHIVGEACLAAASLQSIERRDIGFVAPMFSAVAPAVVGLGSILTRASTD